MQESDEDIEALTAQIVREAELWLETTDLIRGVTTEPQVMKKPMPVLPAPGMSKGKEKA